MTRPTLSIGMPLYNAEEYLADAIDSILGQNFEEFELILSDNGSTDRTAAICKEYAEKDSRIRFFRQDENLGATPNFDFVFQQARGRYFKWAAHDDVLLQGFFSACLACLESDPTVVLACPAVAEIDQHGDLVTRYTHDIDSEAEAAHVRFYEYIGKPWAYHLYGVFRTEVLAQTARIQGYSGSDNFLLAEVMLYGRMVELPERLLHLRVHPGQSTQAHPDVYERASWFDTDKTSPLSFPRWEGVRASVRAIARAPLSASERVKCFAQLARWMGERSHVLAGELRDNVQRYVSSYRRPLMEKQAVG